MSAISPKLWTGKGEAVVRVTWQLQFTGSKFRYHFPSATGHAVQWSQHAILPVAWLGFCTSPNFVLNQNIHSAYRRNTCRLFLHQELPFVCLVLRPKVPLVLFAFKDTHLLLQFVHCTGNALFSLPPVLLGHGVLQILLQLQAQLNGRDKWDKITRQICSSE